MRLTPNFRATSDCELPLCRSCAACRRLFSISSRVRIVCVTLSISLARFPEWPERYERVTPRLELRRVSKSFQTNWQPVMGVAQDLVGAGFAPHRHLATTTSPREPSKWSTVGRNERMGILIAKVMTGGVLERRSVSWDTEAVVSKHYGRNIRRDRNRIPAGGVGRKVYSGAWGRESRSNGDSAGVITSRDPHLPVAPTR